MNYRIEVIPGKKLVGKRSLISFSNNKTSDLWRSFMTVRKEIRNNIGEALYSIQIYTPGFFDNFNQEAEFEKWAAMEVTDFDLIPNDMESYILPVGLYAVFLYKGAASRGASTFQYIIETWLPESEFILDDRPHFEILGDKYKNEDPNSEEEIWIPVKLKNNPEHNSAEENYLCFTG
jgi:AraC family transcriptional regulator